MSSSTPHSITPHPYTNILTDCLSIIFSYHIQHISHNYTHYTEPDLSFLRNHIYCMHFLVSVNAKAFLAETRGKKRHLLYIRATNNASLDNDSFRMFRGIRELHVMWCKNFTDEALENLRGIETLDISNCRSLTSAGFVNLRGVKNLSIGFMPQLNDSALEHLRGIHSLNMQSCLGFTDAGIANLRGIQTLDMSRCHQLTGACFENLRGIQRLVMNSCDRNAIAPADFENLRGIQSLKMDYCHQIPGSALQNLIGIQEFSAVRCLQLCDSDLQYLVGVKKLDLCACSKISSCGLRHVRGVREIDLTRIDITCKDDLSPLREARIVATSLPGTKHVFRNLRRMKQLRLNGSLIETNEVFSNLANVEILELCRVNMEGITDEAFAHLGNLKKLTFIGCMCNGLTKRMLEILAGQMESFHCIGKAQIALHMEDVDDVVRWLSGTKSVSFPEDDAVTWMVMEKWRQVRGNV